MNHIAAIHASAKQLGQSTEDRRVLMQSLVGKSSCKDMSQRELDKVRAHYDHLTEQHSPARQQAAAAFKAAYQAASRKERKIHALWGELGRLGKLKNPSPQALRAYVQNHFKVSHLRFCTADQQTQIIEQLKEWGRRELNQSELAKKPARQRSANTSRAALVRR